MGYNNNYAGMHMIRFGRSRSYEDLAYYDKLAAEKRKKEREIEERLNAEAAKRKAEQSERDKKQQANKSNGKTKIIDDKYFGITDLYTNIYLISLEKKLDVYALICECEKACDEDIRMTDDYNKSYGFMHEMDKTIVFLNMLADKMGCSVSTFWKYDDESRKEYTYSLLENIANIYADNEVCFYFEYGKEDNEDYLYECLSLNADLYLNYNGDNKELKECPMRYYFYKVTDKSSKDLPEYSMIIDTKIPYDTKKIQNFKYMYRGAEIVNENTGGLADYFERVKDNYLKHNGYVFDDIDAID